MAPIPFTRILKEQSQGHRVNGETGTSGSLYAPWGSLGNELLVRSTELHQPLSREDRNSVGRVGSILV